jgi:hypothetical protein
MYMYTLHLTHTPDPSVPSKERLQDYAAGFNHILELNPMTLKAEHILWNRERLAEGKLTFDADVTVTDNDLCIHHVKNAYNHVYASAEVRAGGRAWDTEGDTVGKLWGPCVCAWVGGGDTVGRLWGHVCVRVEGMGGHCGEPVGAMFVCVGGGGHCGETAEVGELCRETSGAMCVCVGGGGTLWGPCVCAWGWGGHDGDVFLGPRGVHYGSHCGTPFGRPLWSQPWVTLCGGGTMEQTVLGAVCVGASAICVAGCRVPSVWGGSLTWLRPPCARPPIPDPLPPLYPPPPPLPRFP